MKATPQHDRKPLNDMTRRRWLKLAAGVSGAAWAGQFLGGREQVARAADDRPKNGPTFANPLFAGDYPDATVLRVGRDFYMTHTSYACAPGLIVWHSPDLVNWTPISAAVEKPHGEIWSPDLVEHGGRYFIYFPMGGIFVVHAEHPRGPWSAPIDLKVKNIDPAHVSGPDGKRYLYSSGGNVIELSDDGLSTVGKSKTVYKGWAYPKDWKTEGFWLESPKLTRRGKYYYLVSAEGGTSGPPTSHMAVVARSESPLGPWENSPYNPLIHTYSAEEKWWSVGHGSLVSTPDDRWYLIHHGYRKDFHTLGRNTLMEPIEWTSDGWPRAPLGANRGEPMPAPMGVAQRPMIPLSDDFKSSDLKLTWGALKESDPTRFKSGGGTLSVRAKGDSFADSSPLLVKARHESYSVQTVAETDTDCLAALGLFYDSKAAVHIQLNAGQLEVLGPGNAKLAARDWQKKSAWLRMDNLQNRVSFLASENGQDWQSLTADFDVSHFNHNDQKRGFQAATPGLAAIGHGAARFSDFVYRELQTAAK
jgi:xylan 1,4-beta-xylosidase